MCGRFTNRFTWKELHERLDLIGLPLNLRPRYNVAPSQDVAVARAADPGSRSGASEGRTLAMLRWGLISGVGQKRGDRLQADQRPVRDRAAEKPSFRSAFRHRRCLILPTVSTSGSAGAGPPSPGCSGLRDGAPMALRGAVGALDGAGRRGAHRIPRRAQSRRRGRDLHHPHHRRQRDGVAGALAACRSSCRPTPGTPGSPARRLRSVRTRRTT